MQLNGSTPSPTYSAHENATERFYASLADGFGDFHGRYLNFGLWEDGVTDYVQAAEHLLARVGLAIGLGVDSRVLDAGCGMGAQDQFLVGRFGCSRIEAIDLTAAHIDVARRHNAYEGQVVYSRANACVLPFADASFTHVIGIEAPVHFRTREAFFHEAGRVLAGGGRIGTSDFVRARDPRGPLEEALVRLGAKAWHIPKENADTPELYASKLGAHGFEDVRVERVGKSVIPGYLEENARPEVRRRIRQIRGRVAGRATRVLDWLVGALWRRGLVDYVLTSARKAA